jgi:cardiolipin synthase
MIKKILIYVCIPLATAISGCQSIPDAEKMIQQSTAKVDTVEIKGSHKNLSNQHVEQVIDNLTHSDEDAALLAQQLKVVQGVTNKPLIAGNDTELLYDGEQTFKAMQEALNAAKNHINLEYFIFENIQFNSRVSLQDILLKKRSEGVDVNVIYDAAGSINTPTAFFETLKNAGVKITEYHPIDINNLDNLNNRDHRKIMVVDGAVAIIGGINLSQNYQSRSGFGSSGSRKKTITTDVDKAHWRDTDLVIKGPAVAELQRLFLKHWDQTQTINQAGFFPKLTAQGNEFIHVIGSSPSDDKPYFYPALIAAIQNANKTVAMSSAYFVPTSEQKKALIKAAKGGAKVDLMLPGLSDSSLAINVQRSYYEDLLENGINIYEVESQVLHAKTISVDGVWSVVGSSNFDYRSVSLNDEVDVIVLGSKTAKLLNEKFKQDQAKAKKIDPVIWRKRPAIDKVKQFFSRAFKKLL